MCANRLTVFCLHLHVDIYPVSVRLKRSVCLLTRTHNQCTISEGADAAALGNEVSESLGLPDNLRTPGVVEGQH